MVGRRPGARRQAFAAARLLSGNARVGLTSCHVRIARLAGGRPGARMSDRLNGLFRRLTGSWVAPGVVLAAWMVWAYLRSYPRVPPSR